MKIAVDAMGGDNAPDEIIKGCLDAIKQTEGFNIELIGIEEKIEEYLSKQTYDKSRIAIANATQIISNSDKPTEAIRHKKDSSMVVGFNKLKEKATDVFISAGSTGALMIGSLFILGRIKGVSRPAVAPIVPSMCGGTMIVDAGMNTMCKPGNFLQFGIMGSEYMKEVYNLKNPRVGLINVGTEDEKGNKQIKQAFELLSQAGLNFIGNIEGKDIPEGNVDVAVCDGFTGNAMLKVMEGTGKFLMSSMKKIYFKNLLSKLSAFLFKSFKTQIDPHEIGGTPILGVDGIVYKCHGNSNSKAVKNTVLKAVNFSTSTAMEQLKYRFKDMEVV